MADPIDPIPDNAIPAPKLGSLVLAATDTALLAWLAGQAALKPLIDQSRQYMDTEQTRGLALAGYLGLAGIDRGAIPIGGVLDAIGGLLTGPGPGLTTGYQLPPHPGYGGDIVPGAGGKAGFKAYVDQIINTILNTLFGAPIV
jgi:hypothetical protein